MRERTSDLLFAVLVAGSFWLVVLAVLIGTGHFAKSDTRTPYTQLAATTARPSRPLAVAHEQASQRRSAAKPRLLSVLITASRGDCWLVAHRGSKTGPILAERLLLEGSTLSLESSRLWLELGAPENIDVSVNGRPRRIPTDTTRIVLQ